MKKEVISIRGARVHNLKNVHLDIPKNAFVVITGLSGSGKSSLAFDTIYAEGQRRYMESLSSYARQFLEVKEKPDVDEIIGLSPTIAIDQKSTSHNPRSTVGTVTEIYDYLRVLFARAGQPHCPNCHQPVEEQHTEQMVQTIERLAKDQDIILLSPVVKEQKGEHNHVLKAAKQSGCTQVRFDGFFMDVEEALQMRKLKQKPHTIEIQIANISQKKIPDSHHLRDLVKKALEYGNGFFVVVSDKTGDECVLSEQFHCPVCKISLPPLEPRLFSFNTPQGACPECMGLGIKLVLDPELLIPNQRLTFAQGAIRPWTRIAGNQTTPMKLLEAVGKKYHFSLNIPVEKISEDKKQIIFYGTQDQTYLVSGQQMVFPGILAPLEQKYRETDSDYVRQELEGYMRTQICPSCQGKRLRPELLAVTIAQKSIADLVQLSVEDLQNFFYSLQQKKFILSEKIPLSACITPFSEQQQEKTRASVLERVAKEILKRTENLCQVGLGYMSLDRTTMSLSGGEAQRVRLATQLGSGLSGVIYILDEPSIGLHPRDNEALIQTMQQLRDLGNTVLVVEHDRRIIEKADYIIDVGPGAGVYGGEIIAKGTLKELKKQKESLTADYLSGKKTIPFPKHYRKGNGKNLTVVGAQAFHLKNIDVSFPLGVLVCVTGVSGSGKSTLVLDVLGKALSKKFYRSKVIPGEHKTIKGIENIDKVVAVDQSPIGRTPRSNPATYTGVFTAIRDVFAELAEAKMRNFDAGKFSFNVKGGGRCEVCAGDGLRRIEMQFMPDVYVTCSECQGTRYHQETLEIHYKGKNIAHVLEMTIEEARRFFSDKPCIYEKLNILYEVGLGYLTLGQPATTLSGGEAQRVKLATELARRATGKTLYILDEPTTGLHFEDIKRLLVVLHRLVDKGNTVLVIEHNMDVIKGADWIIDMGPEGGEKGGYIIAEGTPKKFVKIKNNQTALFLKEMF